MSTDGEISFTRIHRARLPVWLVLLTDWTSGFLSNPSMSTANETQPGMLLLIDRANSVGGVTLGVTSRKVVWLFLEQFGPEFVPVFHRLQGRT